MRKTIAFAFLFFVMHASIEGLPSEGAAAPIPSLTLAPALSLPLGKSVNYYDPSPGVGMAVSAPLGSGALYARGTLDFELHPLFAGPAVTSVRAAAGAGLAFSLLPFLRIGVFGEGGYYHAFIHDGQSRANGGGFSAGTGMELEASLSSSLKLSVEAAYTLELGLRSGLRLAAGLTLPLGSSDRRAAPAERAGFVPLAAAGRDPERRIDSMLSARSGFAFPIGTSTGYYRGGPLANLLYEYPLRFLPGLSFLGRMGYSGLSLKDGSLLSLIDGQLGLGVSYEILPGIGARLRAGSGFSYAFLREDDATVHGSGGAVSAGGGFFMAFPSSFAIGLDCDYVQSLGLFSGLELSLGATFLLGSGASDPVRRNPGLRNLLEGPSGPIQVESFALSPIFPVFRKYYDANPVGTLVVRNSGKSPLKNLRASFYVRQFMDAPKESPPIRELAPGESTEIELYALFTDRILEATEATLAAAVTTVGYDAVGRPGEVSRTDSLRVLDRNALSWRDDRGAAAFVTPKDPSVMTFAKNVAGVVSARALTSVDKDLLMALAMHEALGIHGLAYVIDPKTPYADRSKAPDEIDYLQFPRQTLEYRAGDCDDLSILYCALLESVGVETAFITVPGHIYMACALPGTAAEAARRQQRPEDLVVEGDRAWVPIEVTMRASGFLEAWQEGAKEWREARARNLAKLYPLREAWAFFEPVALPGVGVLAPPPTAVIAERYGAEANRLIERELAPQANRLIAELRKGGNDQKSHNALGALYARYGLFDKAAAEFKLAVAKGEYAPSLVNLGNLSFLDGKLAEAEAYYSRAYAKAPADPGVLLAVARINFSLENYGLAKRAYEALKRADPSLAERFAYLETRGEEATRAAQSGAKEAVVWQE
ncbi:MAG: hypothetical protein JNG85_05245 [Spirochaetaceae bacterium]|nr:hypothetical protein [Spirochaetaceae bacterium]